MAIVTRRINLNTKGDTQIIDITQSVAKELKGSKLKNGIITVFLPGSTGGLTTVEYESGLISDLKRLFERMAPKSDEYQHNLRWQDGNGFSHVRSSMLGPDITIPFVEGELQLGTWQQVVFIDFDNRPRSRELIVQIIGE